MNLTSKQKEILALVVAANKDGSPTDFDELIERLPYKPSKDSMHFSIRALAKKGLIEKGPLEPRRGRSHRLILATALGRHWAALVCAPPPAVTTIEDPDLDAMDDVDIKIEFA